MIFVWKDDMVWTQNNIQIIFKKFLFTLQIQSASIDRILTLIRVAI